VRTDRVGGTYCTAATAPGMGNAVPASAHQYPAAGRFLAARGERVSVCARRRIPRRSGGPPGCTGVPDCRKGGRGCACGVSAGGIFSDPLPGMPAWKGCRKLCRDCCDAYSTPPADGDKDSPVAETEASGTDFAGAGTDSRENPSVGTRLSRCVGQRQAVRVRSSETGECHCSIARSPRSPRWGLE